MVLRAGELHPVQGNTQQGDHLVVIVEGCTEEQTVGFRPGPMETLHVSLLLQNVAMSWHNCKLSLQLVWL